MHFTIHKSWRYLRLHGRQTQLTATAADSGQGSQKHPPQDYKALHLHQNYLVQRHWVKSGLFVREQRRRRRSRKLKTATWCTTKPGRAGRGSRRKRKISVPGEDTNCPVSVSNVSLTRRSSPANARHTYHENVYPMSIDDAILVLTRMLHQSHMLH